jgi:hypothetical protein
MVLMVPLLIMATSLVSKINTSVALLKGWVNSFLAFMGQLYLGFYTFFKKLKKREPTVHGKDTIKATIEREEAQSECPTETSIWKRIRSKTPIAPTR